MPAPVRFNWYFMSMLTFEAVSGRMVGRRCGWRSYVYSPRRPRKRSPLHSLGHQLTMEARSTLRKPSTAISLFFEVQRHSAMSYNSYMASHSQKVFFYSIVFLQFSVIMMVDIFRTICALPVRTTTLGLFFDITVLMSRSKMAKHSE